MEILSSILLWKSFEAEERFDDLAFALFHFSEKNWKHYFFKGAVPKMESW